MIPESHRDAICARVAGVGQETAGDDGVGLVVAQAVRGAAATRGLQAEVHEITEPSRLIPLLETPGPVVIVDAVLGPEPGTVLSLPPEAFEAAGATPLTTHGLGVAQAVGLARTLYGAAVSPAIRVVGIGIALPEPYRHALSAPVAAAVPRAVEAVLEIVKGG